MAKNDIILLDGVIEERVKLNLPSKDLAEAFEYLASEQIIKRYDLSMENIINSIVDGRNDGGIDAFFIFINGHLLMDVDDFMWPKLNSVIDVFVITCKHHNTYKLSTLDSLISSITELFDFSIDEQNLKSEYNEELLEKRKNLIIAYKVLAISLQQFNITIAYASRGDTSCIGENVLSKSNYIRNIIESYFSNCNLNIEFWGAKELLQEYRKRPNMSLELNYKEVLSKNQNYVILTDLNSYCQCITDEKFKLKKYLFDSNVRDFVGLNRVNEDIMSTLKENESPDFWLLNNGITILATSAIIVGKTINIENVQIVNGLQTTETIYRFFSEGNSDLQDRSILIKIIVTSDNIVRDKIIRATNNQTSVELYSLHATDKIQRDIEEILLKYGLYYERKLNYYANQGISQELIFTPLYLASGYVNLVLKLPAIAASLKSRFMSNKDLYNKVFSENTDLEIWPAIAKILRKTDLLLEELKENSIISRVPSEKYKRNLRHIVSFITIAKILKTFNFSIRNLIDLNIEIYSKEKVETTLLDIIEVFPEFFNLRDLTRETIVLKVCKHIKRKYKISDFGMLFIDRREKIMGFRKKIYDMDEEFINQVNLLLPDQPWPIGIHREISNKLNCPANKVHTAINELIKSGRRYSQIEGELFDNNGTKIKI